MRGRGRNTGDFVSSHLRSGIAGFFLVAGFSTPAFSNAFTDLFSANAAPAPSTAAAAPAKEECLPQPGRSSAAGQHWVYRFDGQRKCWFQAAEETSLARKPVRHRLERRSVAASEEDKPAPRQQKDVEDANAEMLSSAPEQTPQPAPLEPKLTIVRTVPVRIGDAAAMVPPAPDLDKPGADQLTPDQPRRPDVETLLAEAPAASSEVASAPGTPVAAPGANTGGGEHGMTSWLGVLLIVLGGTARSAPSSDALDSPCRRCDFGTPGRSSRSQHTTAGAIPPSARASDRPAPGGTSVQAMTRNAGQRRYLPYATAGPWPPPCLLGNLFWDEGIDALAALASPVSPGMFSPQGAQRLIAGCSSEVTRQAHNPEVASSDFALATKLTPLSQRAGGFLLFRNRRLPSRQFSRQTRSPNCYISDNSYSGSRGADDRIHAHPHWNPQEPR